MDLQYLPHIVVINPHIRFFRICAFFVCILCLHTVAGLIQGIKAHCNICAAQASLQRIPSRVQCAAEHAAGADRAGQRAAHPGAAAVGG